MVTHAAKRERIRNPELMNRIVSAGEAAEMIRDGMVIGVSGFTPSGYPKAVPLAIAERVKNGERLKLSLYSGASLGPEIDELWASLGIISARMPYQTSSCLRKNINEGTVDYIDLHLSHFPQCVSSGTVPKIDVAIVEALAITEEGGLVPTTGIGSTPVFVKNADRVIVEINTAKPMDLEGMADIYTAEDPPGRRPIGVRHPGDRIGQPYISCDLNKIAAVVISDLRDQTRTLGTIDAVPQKISDNIIAFLNNEVEMGRLTDRLLPIQSGVGSVANAVLYGLCGSDFRDLTCYTEVVQDSMLDLLRCGKASVASATAVSPSPAALVQFEKDINFFKDKIILRPQDISNNPEIIRRLGVISMNTALEADIYGNVNSTHVLGTEMMNGIGGSGDFARNAAISIFSTESVAKGGAISSIVPMVSHVDHTEHDVMVIVTEQGYADLRGLNPRRRAEKIIDNCAHPDYRERLWDYFTRACKKGALHTPHILEEALSWHSSFEKTGTMKK